MPSGAHRDDAGRLRLVLPPQRLADYLALALDEAAQYGADSRQVQQCLDALLATYALPLCRSTGRRWRLTRRPAPASPLSVGAALR
ncbi:MAG: DUF2254 family protein [Mycobacteriales bacterium]